MPLVAADDFARWNPGSVTVSSVVTATTQPDYDPFVLTHRPHSWPMREAQSLDSQTTSTGSDLQRFGYAKDQSPQVIIDTPEFGADFKKPITIIISDSLGHHRSPTWTLENQGFAAPNVWFADLNRDQCTDVVIRQESTGCGLYGYLSRLIVLLSTPTGDWNGYELETYLYDSRNLVVDPDTQGCMVITTHFFFDQGHDGRSHSFWMHSADLIDGGSIHPAASAFWSGFPKCIQYTLHPNHQPTRLLSPAQLATAVTAARHDGWKPVPRQPAP